MSSTVCAADSHRPTPFLIIPGPTPLPDAVREALSRPAIGHRSADFKRVLERVFPKLQWLFQTRSDVFLYTASGTGAMEAALVNVLNPADRLLVLSCGVFSDRWAEIGRSLGLDVTVAAVEHGQANTVDALREALDAAKAAGRPFRAVALTHSETSTGVLNPVAAMTPLIQQHGALSIVDAVTSLGAAPFDFDGWGVDLAVSGSQKGLMLPPGLSVLAVSERAMAAHRDCQNPGYYFNFSRYQKAQAEFTTPYTPATALIIALDIALSMMQAEGLPGIWQRHAKLQAMTRAGVEALGLSCFVTDDALASPAVTSVLPPAGVPVDAIRKGLREDYGIVVADGQKALKGKIFRIGHLGHVFERDVFAVLSALQHTLASLGDAPPSP